MTAIERITKRLAETEEREKRSTGGPWNSHDHSRNVTYEGDGIICKHVYGYADAEFIATSRTDIPALRKALELLLAVANTPAGITSIEILNEKIADILEGEK